MRSLRAGWLNLRSVGLVGLMCQIVLLQACERPSVLVICHNANCKEPTDPFQDDKIHSLQESLALTYQGLPVLDGMEFDIFWYGAANAGQGRCLFAHDLDTAKPYTPAQEGADTLAQYFASVGPISYNRERFVVRMELKGHVGGVRDQHTPQQALQHAECALDVYETLVEAALLHGRQLVIVFDSFNPLVLKKLITCERWPGSTPYDQIEVRLSADFVDSTSSGLAFQRLADFPAVDDVVFHAGWVTDGHYQAFRSLGLDLTLWMFSATTQHLDAIERFEPEAVLTSEARLLRRWLAY